MANGWAQGDHEPAVCSAGHEGQWFPVGHCTEHDQQGREVLPTSALHWGSPIRSTGPSAGLSSLGHTGKCWESPAWGAALWGPGAPPGGDTLRAPRLPSARTRGSGTDCSQGGSSARTRGRTAPFGAPFQDGGLHAPCRHFRSPSRDRSATASATGHVSRRQDGAVQGGPLRGVAAVGSRAAPPGGAEVSGAGPGAAAGSGVGVWGLPQSAGTERGAPRLLARPGAQPTGDPWSGCGAPETTSSSPPGGRGPPRAPSTAPGPQRPSGVIHRPPHTPR